MNITLLANRDLASNLALNHLLPGLADRHRLRVFLSDAVGGKAARAPELQHLKYFEQTLFNELLFPLVDAGEQQGELLTFRGLERFTGGPVASLNGINRPEGLATLRDTAPDLVLSIRYGGILKDEAIGIPPLGVINLHSGALPDYRGVMATFQAMLAGETTIGTTLHYIRDAGIDTGDIIARTEQPLDKDSSYLANVLALYAPACEKLLACVAEVDRGEPLPARDQPPGGQYFSFPDAADLAAFRDRGLVLYNTADITAIAKRYTGIDV